MDEYIKWVWDRLPPIPSEETQYVRDCIVRCFEDGFTREDALSFTRLTEHVNPDLSEDYACSRMNVILRKYRPTKG